MIKSVGEDVNVLRKYGILLDNEADVFDSLENSATEERYLMQIFTYPVFQRDTFFLEVIQRKGARGFGVGNVTALARSVNAYNQALKRKLEEEQERRGNERHAGNELDDCWCLCCCCCRVKWCSWQTTYFLQLPHICLMMQVKMQIKI